MVIIRVVTTCADWSHVRCRHCSIQLVVLIQDVLNLLFFPFPLRPFRDVRDANHKGWQCPPPNPPPKWPRQKDIHSWVQTMPPFI